MDPRIAELIIRLQENPFFRPLDVGIVKQIAQSVQEVTFGVGDQIIKPDDVANDFFIISQGHAKKQISHAFGADAATGVLKSGEFFGHFSLIYRVPHGLSIIAMETLYLFKIPKDKFVQLYNQHPDFAALFSSRVIRDSDFADRIRPLSFFNILTIEQLANILPHVNVELFPDEANLQARYQAGDLLVIDFGELQVTCEGNGRLQKITMTRGNYLTLLSEPKEVSFKVVAPLVCFTVNQDILDDYLLNETHGTVLKSFLDRSLVMSHLQKTTLFGEVTGADLALLAWTVAQAVFDANRYIYRQGDPGLRYYMVYNGKIEVRVLNKDGKRPPGNPERYEIVSPEGSVSEGYKQLPQYSYGENELFFGLPSGKGLWAMGRTELLFINQSTFTYLRKNNTDFGACLNPDANIRQKLQFADFKFDDKREEEEVIYACHRHWISFALSLVTSPSPGLVRVPVTQTIWPTRETFVLIFMGVVALLWLSWSYLMQVVNRFYYNSMLALSPSPMTMSLFAVLLVVLILWVLWNWVDWRNDYLVVTTKRVVRREKLVLLHEDQAQSELVKVEKVVTKAGFMGNMLGYCDLMIETAAPDGHILLDKAPQTSQLYNWLTTLPFVGRFVPPPNKIFAHNIIETILKEQAEHRKVMMMESGLGGLQTILRKQMSTGKSDAWMSAPVDSPPPPKLSRWGVFRKSFNDTNKTFWDGVLPWRLHGVPGNAKKIWHKHWLNLLWHVVDSMLSFIVVTVFVVIYFAGLHVYLRFVPSLASLNDVMPYLDFVVVAIYIIISLRFWWELADWSNDLYILTDKQLIDIEKKPLYFAEKRDQVELSKIQSISFTQIGFIDTLFKIGDVKIEMPGGSPIIFRRVPNPREVQNEIFKQMDDVKTKARQKEVEDQVKSLAQWFDAYHNTFIRVN